jgi:hypothetical protein
LTTRNFPELSTAVDLLDIGRFVVMLLANLDGVKASSFDLIKARANK